MWDLPGPGIKPMSPCIGRRILNHCATREVPYCPFLMGFAAEVRNHLCFQSIPKSSTSPKAYLPSAYVITLWSLAGWHPLGSTISSAIWADFTSGGGLYSKGESLYEWASKTVMRSPRSVRGRERGKIHAMMDESMRWSGEPRPSSAEASASYEGPALALRRGDKPLPVGQGLGASNGLLMFPWSWVQTPRNCLISHAEIDERAFCRDAWGRRLLKSFFQVPEACSCLVSRAEGLLGLRT